MSSQTEPASDPTPVVDVKPAEAPAPEPAADAPKPDETPAPVCSFSTLCHAFFLILVQEAPKSDAVEVSVLSVECEAAF